MLALSCVDMGNTTCDFVATGENNEDVMKMMMDHVKEKHADVMQQMAAEQMEAAMLSKIKPQ